MLAATPTHPLFVHLPMALAVLMPLLSFGLLLAWWRGWFRPRTWSIAVAAQALLAVSGFVAMRTGEADEERVERVVAESAIEAHEEAAEVFTWSAVLVLALSVLPLLLHRRPAPAQLAALGASVATLAVLGLGYRVGAAGGELVYRHGAANAFATAAGAQALPATTPRGDRDDDDR